MEETPRRVLVKLFVAIITETDPIPTPAALFYDADRPFQVTFCADENTDTGEHVEWNYSRELLYNALHGEEEVLYGEGDVKTFRERGYIYTIFSQGERQVCLAFNPGDVLIFLTATEDIIPFGEEVVDDAAMDAELFRMLGSSEE